jgi:transcriptional regulator with GAF, ATPase, and Fis domain
MLARRTEESADAGGDVLEVCLARALVLLERQSAESAREQASRSLSGATTERMRESERVAAAAQREAEELRRRAEALERAAGHATEMLMEAHVEIDRKSQRHQRQTRVLYLLRKMLENHARGMPPETLAQEIVATVSEAFGGSRCSLMLINEAAGELPELRLAAGVGLPPEMDASGVRIPLGSGVSGGVARSRVPVVVREPDEGDQHSLMGDEWYTGSAFVSLPLVCRNQLLGVLNLTNFRAGTVDDFEVEQLRLVALCVGLLADHAGLGQRLFEPRQRIAG